MEATRTVVRDLLGLDTLDGETPGIDSVGRLQVGTSVPDRGSAAESRGPETRDSQRLRVEYQLLGPVLIAGEQSFSGAVGGDVILRFRFR